MSKQHKNRQSKQSKQQTDLLSGQQVKQQTDLLSRRQANWQLYCQKEGGPLLVLDRIQDIQNAGSMARSAESLGAKALLLCGKGAKPNEAFYRISKGAALFLPCFQIGNLDQCIRILRQLDFWICGSAAPKRKGDSRDNGLLLSYERESKKKSAGRTEEAFQQRGAPLFLKHFESARLPERERLALLIGNEHSGLQQSMLRKCDFILTIPLLGKTESLNAAVAAAILLDRIIHR